MPCACPHCGQGQALPYLQGYLPILQACLTKKYGFSGLHIDTGSSFIDESNIDLIEVLVKQQIR